MNVYVTAQHIGKQYLDNSENEKKNPSARNAPGYTDKFINAYTVFNAGISYDVISSLSDKRIKSYLNSIELSLKVNNIFDRLYETSGSVDWYGTPYWIPAAERNFYVNLKVGL